MEETTRRREASCRSTPALAMWCGLMQNVVVVAAAGGIRKNVKISPE